MAGAAVWAGAAVLVLAVLLFLQVPLWGVGPRCVKQIWTRIIRCWKRGDKRVWSWSEVEPGLYVGSLPRSPDDLRELQVAPHNLRAVVSLVEAWEMKVSTSDFAHLDIEWLHLPTPDYTAPRSRDVERAATFIDRQICRGRGVLVHCNAGRGRSVVAAIAYLLLKHKADGWDRYAALEAVQRVRKTAPLLQCCQTRPQWRAVCAFERLMRREGHVGCPYWIAGPPVPYHGTTALGTTAHSDGSIRDAAALTAAAAASPGAEAGAGLGVGPVCGRGAAGLQAPEAAVTRDEARGHAPADLGDEPGAPAARRGSMLLLLRPLPPSVTPREGGPPQLYPLPPLVVAHPPDEVGNGGEDVPMPSQSAEPSIPMTLQAAGKPAERDDGSLHQLVVDEQDVARASLSSIDLRASGAAVDAVMREARTAGGAGHVILPGTPQR